ncbi:transposase [Streptomyces olivaceus]|uniref:transposase n=2 Tax=Streptomyces olivaceus TaxID=47716 RepID=UPI0027DFB5B5|nr:transposase [Streptomyces olivaceus]
MDAVCHRCSTAGSLRSPRYSELRPHTSMRSWGRPTGRGAFSGCAASCSRCASRLTRRRQRRGRQATHMTLRTLAERIKQLTAQINELNQRLTRLVEHRAPQLLVLVGVGPDSAVTLLITMGDNPERLNTEASFAALCGVSPIEYSSGQRSTRRLNHGGDRQANAPCTASSSPGCATIPAPRRTTNAAPRRARPAVSSSDVSSDTRPARSSTWSDQIPAPPRYRGVPSRYPARRR